MDSLLQGSSATPDFKTAVASFLAGSHTELLKVENYVPPIKVRRLLTQLLNQESGLGIQHVVIRGSSGCSDFRGSVEVHTSSGPHVFDFVWDCRWRAESEGYVDYFGFPDQRRAADEFDWRCFQQWDRRAMPN